MRACMRACLECQCQVVYCHFSGQTILYSDIVSSIFGVKVSLLYEIMVKPDSSRPWWHYFFLIFLLSKRKKLEQQSSTFFFFLVKK